jgi:hypothetical protein
MTKLRRYRTNRLFHRTSVLDGIGSIINIPGNYFDFNYSNSGEEADRVAIENDWGVVGDDIRKAAKKTNDELLQLQD